LEEGKKKEKKKKEKNGNGNGREKEREGGCAIGHCDEYFEESSSEITNAI